MKILHETEQHLFAQENDGVRALGLLSMLSSMAPNLSGQPHFVVVEQLRDAIDAQQYAVLFERADKDAVAKVPVAFVTWAFMSQPVEYIYLQRYRPLQRVELTSGSRLWATMFFAPFGHAEELQLAFGAAVAKDRSDYRIGRTKDGMPPKVAVMPNLAKRRKG
jgi:hemolysin-activating ACP:hemolysin acyltransferase